MTMSFVACEFSFMLLFRFVLNTEMRKCSLYFSWGAFSSNNLLFLKLEQPRYIPHWPCDLYLVKREKLIILIIELWTFF